MNFNQEIVFCYLEEDNDQRAYFRILPLLMPSGECREEAMQSWPDDGALRIVPDRNEQGYFKDRMRAMGHFCLMDLTPFAPDANKIRTNKNYRPNREERNQFILYSDAVKALPEHTFLQILSGSPEEAAVLAEKAATPLFMIRSGDTVYGPVHKAAPAVPAPAPEMTAELHTLTLPDGTTVDILCTDAFGSAPKYEHPVETRLPVKPFAASRDKAAPASAPAGETPAAEAPAKAEPAPAPAPAAPEAPAEPAVPETLPIGEKLDILAEHQDFESNLTRLNQPLSSGANRLKMEDTPAPVPEELPRQSLNGTPLNRAPVVRTAPARPKNRVQEVVAREWNSVRNDPPAPPLPEGTAMRHVENPVEKACGSLTAAWQIEAAKQQLTDHILSLPGMGSRLLTGLVSASKESPLQHALQLHLNDLEAERLSAIVMLDQAKNDLENFRKSALEDVQKKTAARMKEAEQLLGERTARLEALGEELNGLTAQRNALTDAVSKLLSGDIPAALKQSRLVLPFSGQPVTMSSLTGTVLEPADMVTRVTEAFAKSGVTCSRPAAAALLALCASSSKLSLPTPTPGSAVTLIRNVMKELGWESGFGLQTNAQQSPDPRPAGDTPMVMVSTLPTAPRTEGVTVIQLCDRPGSASMTLNYQTESWPILPLKEIPFVAESTEAPAGKPLSLAPLKAAALPADILPVLKPLFACTHPLNGKSFRELERFVAAASLLMEGGLAQAMDWAILLWILPMAVNKAALAEQLAEYPLSREKL